MGTIAKDTSVGPFIDEWKKAFETISKDTEEVDITPALSAAALAVKDENELVSHRHHHVIAQPPLRKGSVRCAMLQELVLGSWQDSSSRKCPKFWMKKKR